MSRREVIAYAITHAPKGQRGGPYESVIDFGAQVPTLRDASLHRFGYRPSKHTLARIRARHPHARVIRIVRARPSEASAVEVLRELVAWDGGLLPCFFSDVLDKARAVLAGAGPDPMPVVRAALRFAEHCTPALEGSAWFEATREFIDAVDTYRKAGGK